MNSVLQYEGLTQSQEARPRLTNEECFYNLIRDPLNHTGKMPTLHELACEKWVVRIRGANLCEQSRNH